jgi:hypothetical protein
MIPTSSPNAEQKEWRELVRASGSIVRDFTAPKIEIHHPAGRTAKHNKIQIGHWWILPLTPRQHSLIDSDKSEFEMQALDFVPGGRWDCEKYLFRELLRKVGSDHVPWEVYAAIMDYRR